MCHVLIELSLLNADPWLFVAVAFRLTDSMQCVVMMLSLGLI